MVHRLGGGGRGGGTRSRKEAPGSWSTGPLTGKERAQVRGQLLGYRLPLNSTSLSPSCLSDSLVSVFPPPFESRPLPSSHLLGLPPQRTQDPEAVTGVGIQALFSFWAATPPPTMEQASVLGGDAAPLHGPPSSLEGAG